MKNTLKGYLIGVLSTIMLFGCVAYAASNTKTIEAIYNNIKIYVDGVKIDPKDANGNTVEPFIYNGTTYLPVRAIGEAIGKTVSWDGATQSVYIGEKPGDVQYLMEVCPPYETDKYTDYTTSNGKSFIMSGKAYTNGFTLSGMVGSMSFPRESYAIINLDGKYNKLSFNMGHVDKTAMADRTINFYLDGKLAKSYVVTGDSLPQKIEIPLNGAMQLKIEVDASKGTTGFGNITVE